MSRASLTLCWTIKDIAVRSHAIDQRRKAGNSKSLESFITLFMFLWVRHFFSKFDAVIHYFQIILSQRWKRIRPRVLRVYLSD